MQVANKILSQWAPALLVCFTVVLGMFFQNSRMNDMNERIDDLKGAVDNRLDDMNKRFDDLKDYITSEFKRVNEKRLESPIVRK
jgi:hypothetical protein